MLSVSLNDADAGKELQLVVVVNPAELTQEQRRTEEAASQRAAPPGRSSLLRAPAYSVRPTRFELRTAEDVSESDVDSGSGQKQTALVSLALLVLEPKVMAQYALQRGATSGSTFRLMEAVVPAPPSRDLLRHLALVVAALRKLVRLIKSFREMVHVDSVQGIKS